MIETSPEIERDEKIIAWNQACDELIAAKSNESRLRKEVIDLLFPNHKDKGTENYELGNGYKIKAVFKENFKLDKDKLDDVMTEICTKIQDGDSIAAMLFKFKPELVEPEYNKASDEVKVIINKALTITPGTPQLELIVPKVIK